VGNGTSKPKSNDVPEHSRVNNYGKPVHLPALFEQNRECSTASTGRDLKVPPPSLRDHHVLHANSRIDPSAMVRNGVSQSSINAATVHLTITVRAWGLGMQDAFRTAIEKLKRINVIDSAKALVGWLKQSPRKVIYTVCVLFPLLCTGAALPTLSLVGFGSEGIRAGTYIYIPMQKNT
jgi:hypothetical protein